MKLHLIAIHKDSYSSKNIIGFRIFDSDNNQTKDVNYQEVKKVIENNIANIIGLGIRNGELYGTNGSLDRYTTLVNNKLYGDSSIVIINSIDSYGYTVCDYKGNMRDASTDDIIKLCNNYDKSIANGKIIIKDNSKYISSIAGTYDNKPANINNKPSNINNKPKNIDTQPKNIDTQPKNIDSKAKNTEENSGYKLKGYDPRKILVVSDSNCAESHLKDLDEKTGMTVEQKLVSATLILQKVRPLYYCIYSLLKKVESSSEQGVDTMGVSTDTLYINSNFVKQLTLPELLFVLMHEICHIAMLHRVRGYGKNHDAWNIATDFYINKSLADEFGIKAIATETKIIVNNSESKYRIAIPEKVLFNNNIDVNKDTPEKLYEELEQNINNAQNDDSSGDNSSSGNSSFGNSSSSNSGDSTGDNSSSSDSGENSSNSDNNTGDNSSSSGSGENSSSDNNSGDNSSSSNSGENSSNENNNTGDNNDSGNKGNNSTENGNDNGSSNKHQTRFENKEFRGSKIEDYSVDIVEEKNSKSKSMESKAQESRALISQANTIYKNTYQGGPSNGFIERQIEEMLAPRVNWRNVIRRFLTKASKVEYSYAHPDRRFLSYTNSRGEKQAFTGPYKKGLGELENIKICIDTSGSISNKDIGIALNQIKDLFNKYKASAELLYWDTEVRAVYEFKKVDELFKKKPMGGGGTNVNCIFEYFETNKDYKLHRKKEPSLLIIFTDGYCGKADTKYKRKYKNTIYIVSEMKDFSQPFGIVADIKEPII